MSAWGALGPATRGLILAAGAAAVAGVGYLGWQVSRPVAAPPPVEAAADAAADPAPETAPTSGDADEAQTEAPGSGAATPDLPRIDTWRVAPDGEALVAGMAQPGAVVEVLVDGRTVADGQALATGEFVLQFTLAPNPAPSLLRLTMQAPDADAILSDEVVALGPIAGPAPVLAAATPDAGAEPIDDQPVAATVPAEPAAPQALLLTDEGAVVLQNPDPADPMPQAQVMIETIAYSSAGEVQIGGRGSAGASLRLYLDNAEVALVPVPDDGRWLVTLGDTAPGIYTLRVDQIDAGGKVTSRFETPFKRETLEALAEAAGQADVVEEGAVDATPAPEATPDAAQADLPDAGEETTAVAAPDAAGAVPDQGIDVAAPELEPATETAATPTTAEPQPVAMAEAPPVTVTVQPGFTLWGIAQDQMGDGVMYVQVFDANRDKIRDPDLIYPGQVLILPASP